MQSFMECWAWRVWGSLLSPWVHYSYLTLQIFLIFCESWAAMFAACPRTRSTGSLLPTNFTHIFFFFCFSCQNFFPEFSLCMCKTSEHVGLQNHLWPSTFKKAFLFCRGWQSSRKTIPAAWCTQGDRTRALASSSPPPPPHLILPPSHRHRHHHPSLPSACRDGKIHSRRFSSCTPAPSLSALSVFLSSRKAEVPGINFATR